MPSPAPFPPPRPLRRLRLDADLLIALRWGSVLAMAAITLGFPRLLGITIAPLPLLATATFLALVNGAAMLLRHWDREPIPAMTQLMVDLLSWSIVIYFSGGATNPLISLLLPVVAIGAAMLPTLQAWLLGAFSILTYSFLWNFYQPLEVKDATIAVQLHLLGMWLTFLASVLISVWFITRMTAAIRIRDQALARARENEIRNGWVVSLGTLAAGAAHELSTPLATMKLVVDDLVEDAELPPRTRHELAGLKLQIDKCKSALTRLTAEAGRPRAEERRQRRVQDWLEECAHGWRALHPAASIALRIDAEAAGRLVAADVALEQALHNLVDNGVRFSPEWLEVSAAVHGPWLHLVIADQGPGIPEDVLAAAGQPLPVHSDSGLGIGLLLARSAIQRCGGQLHLAPRQPRGTDVTLKLPLKDC